MCQDSNPRPIGHEPALLTTVPSWHDRFIKISTLSIDIIFHVVVKILVGCALHVFNLSSRFFAYYTYMRRSYKEIINLV